jgi:probable phosphoglycerate mutase
MRSRIHLVRHGETDWNAERRVQGQADSQLSDNGRSQARALQANACLQDISRVYSSDLSRTRQTATIFLDQQESLLQQTDIVYRRSLREIHLGPWQGRLYAEIEQSHPQDYQHFRAAPHLFKLPGAETFHELQQRGVTAIEKIAQECAGLEALVVSHGALIKTVLCHYEGRSISELWRPPTMHNCAHSIIEYSTGGTARIIRYADAQSW